MKSRSLGFALCTLALAGVVEADEKEKEKLVDIFVPAGDENKADGAKRIKSLSDTMNQMLNAGLSFTATIAPYENSMPSKTLQDGSPSESTYYIGVQLRPFSPKRAGLLVLNVVDESPAKETGLQAGDVIIETDGKVLRTVKDFNQAVQAAGPKKENLSLSIIREGTMTSISVVPTKRSIAEANEKILIDLSPELSLEGRVTSEGVFYFHPVGGQTSAPNSTTLKLEPFHIGVSCKPVDSVLRSQLKLKAVGLIIEKVTDPSPAKDAGLLEADVLTEINGKEVKTFQDLVREVQAAGKKNEKLLLSVIRQGAKKTIEVTPIEQESKNTPEINMTTDLLNNYCQLLESQKAVIEERQKAVIEEHQKAAIERHKAALERRQAVIEGRQALELLGLSPAETQRAAGTIPPGDSCNARVNEGLGNTEQKHDQIVREIQQTLKKELQRTHELHKKEIRELIRAFEQSIKKETLEKKE